MKQFFLLLLCCVSLSALGQVADDAGSSGGNVSLTGFEFPCIPVGTSKQDHIVLSNPGTTELIVTDISVEDTVHFVLIPPPLPVTVPPGGQLTIPVRYTATAVETNTSTVHLKTESATYAALVAGCGLMKGSVRDHAAGDREELRSKLARGEQFAWLSPTPNPSDRQTPRQFVFGVASPASVMLEIFDMNGKSMIRTSPTVYLNGMHEIALNMQALVAGTYIYLYSIDGDPYSGILTIR